MERRSERGSVLVLVAVVLALVVALMLVLVSLAARAVTRADAQSAADAAALAGVLEGESGAAELAARNGASLVSFEASGSGVRVVVVIGSVQAEAYADPGWGTVGP